MPLKISKGDIVIIEDVNLGHTLGLVDSQDSDEVTLSRAWRVDNGAVAVTAARHKNDLGEMFDIGRTVIHVRAIVATWTLNNWAVADLDKLPHE